MAPPPPSRIQNLHSTYPRVGMFLRSDLSGAFSLQTRQTHLRNHHHDPSLPSFGSASPSIGRLDSGFYPVWRYPVVVFCVS